MKALKKCKICGGKDFDYLFEEGDRFAGVKGKFKLSKCNGCSAIFLNPFPEPEDIGSFYPKSYYSYSKVNTRSLKTRLRIKYYTTFNKKFSFLKILMTPLSIIFTQSVPPKKGKLLDIGCGSGQYLYEMKQLGFDVYGSEIGDFDEASNKKLGLNIKRENFVKENKYKSNSFDVVTLNHVLEHMDKPIESIREIRRILKKGGRFYVGVPNTGSLGYRFFGKDWFALEIPRHLINYNRKLMKRILEEEGFEIVRLRSCSRYDQIGASMAYSINTKSKLLKKILNALSIIPAYVSNALGAGEQIEVSCIKK